ncbi:hypothetical protein BDW22DRAFT_1324532 [Trametopsis cervina]|nr:hypothetical protein BDW22DRAFT_1324532 [Trametopsis cervina]
MPSKVPGAPALSLPKVASEPRSGHRDCKLGAEECCHNCNHRSVRLPLLHMNHCQVCRKARSREVKLLLCAACGERAYCGTECQKSDWVTHKDNCGQTHRISLESYFPFLAYMAELCHLSAIKPVHPASVYKIVNNVNPHVNPIKQPDGWESKLVILDDVMGPLPMSARLDDFALQWFPGAISAPVASKLMRRIAREGYALSVVTSVCVALLAEMYTTSSGKDTDDYRLRFKYKSSPIADFGIATGSAMVPPVDRLAYYRRSNGEITHGQDPDDHYWLYFTTTRGEDIELDFSMFTFNMCITVTTQGYVSPLHAPFARFVPAFFKERIVRQSTPSLHTERARFSALRNKDMQRAIMHSAQEIYPCDAKYIFRFMRQANGGRELTHAEKQMTIANSSKLLSVLAENLGSRYWQLYPDVPSVGFEGDPGDTNYMHEPGFAAEMEAQKAHSYSRRKKASVRRR